MQNKYRLTERDIDQFRKIASMMIRHEDWAAVTRASRDDADYFDIQPAGAAEPTYSIGRCSTGNYMLLDHKTGGVQVALNFSALIEQLT